MTIEPIIDDARVSTVARLLTDVSGRPSANPMSPSLNETRDEALLMLEEAAGTGVRFVIPEDKEWPDSLNDLVEDTPNGLWVLGDAPLKELTGRSAALAGARAATSYGESVATDLTEELCDAGFTVVTGGAYGIDAAAMRAANVFRKLTVVVSAVWPAQVYPQGNARLFENVLADGGLVVSESFSGIVANRKQFLRRNRILAALTEMTVIVEAGLRSGAIDVAEKAHCLGRPVGAVPGPVTSAASGGCHALIRNGVAGLVTGVDDVLALLGHH